MIYIAIHMLKQVPMTALRKAGCGDLKSVTGTIHAYIHMRPARDVENSVQYISSGYIACSVPMAYSLRQQAKAVEPRKEATSPQPATSPNVKNPTRKKRHSGPPGGAKKARWIPRTNRQASSPPASTPREGTVSNGAV